MFAPSAEQSIMPFSNTDNVSNVAYIDYSSSSSTLL